jgi:hypothetical protein
MGAIMKPTVKGQGSSLSINHLMKRESQSRKRTRPRLISAFINTKFLIRTYLHYTDHI